MKLTAQSCTQLLINKCQQSHGYHRANKTDNFKMNKHFQCTTRLGATDALKGNCREQFKDSLNFSSLIQGGIDARQNTAYDLSLAAKEITTDKKQIP